MAEEGTDQSVPVEQVPEDDPLQAIEDGITGQIPEAMRDDVEKVVMSGKQLLYDKKTHKHVMDGFKQIDDPNDARKVALGVAGMLTIINRETDKITVEVMIPAGVLIIVEVVRFMTDAGRFTPTPEFIGNAVEEYLAAMMQKMGMGKQKPPPGPQGPPQGRPQGPPQQSVPNRNQLPGLVGAA